jgi:hypothetical protein
MCAVELVANSSQLSALDSLMHKPRRLAQAHIADKPTSPRLWYKAVYHTVID